MKEGAKIKIVNIAIVLAVIALGAVFVATAYKLGELHRHKPILIQPMTILKIELIPGNSEGRKCRYYFGKVKDQGYELAFVGEDICGSYAVNDNIVVS